MQNDYSDIQPCKGCTRRTEKETDNNATLRPATPLTYARSGGSVCIEGLHMSTNQSKARSSATETASNDVNQDDRIGDLPILNSLTLQNFLDGQHSNFLKDFAPHFQEMTRYRLTAASRAAEEGNWTAVVSSVREMGLEAKSLGLLRWEAQCRKIETFCADGRTDAAGRTVGDLQQYCLEGVDAVRRFRST